MLELDERMQDLRNELQSFEGEEYDESHKKKAVDALKRMENWNLFSDTSEVIGFIEISYSTLTHKLSTGSIQEIYDLLKMLAKVDLDAKSKVAL